MIINRKTMNKEDIFKFLDKEINAVFVQPAKDFFFNEIEKFFFERENLQIVTIEVKNYPTVITISVNNEIIKSYTVS